MPLPSTRVIPDGWSEHHAPVSEDAMRGLGDLTRASKLPPNRNNETMKVTPATPTSVARSVPFRLVGDQGTDRPVEVGEQVDRLRRYILAIPIDTAEPRVNDVFTATDSPDDATLEGRPLTILDVGRGTEGFERVLVCSDQG